MTLQINRRRYWMGMIAWLAAFWLVDKAAAYVAGPIEWALITLWAFAGVPLMCGRLADAGAPWRLGLVPIPLAIAALGAAGAVYLEKNRHPEAGWPTPALFVLIAVALLAVIVAPVVIGLLAPRPRAAADA